MTSTVKREDVEALLKDMRFSSTRGQEQLLRGHQALLLLEIRDLVAKPVLTPGNPMLEVPPKPSRAQRRTLRIDWACALEGSATFMCVDCRRLVLVSEDQMRGLPGPWITLRCQWCQRAFELDARELGGDVGKMMRGFFPFIDEKGPGKITPTQAMCEPCAQGNCRECKGHKVCDHYHAWEGESP